MKSHTANLAKQVQAAIAAVLLMAPAFASHAADDLSDTKKYLPWEKGYVKFGGFATDFDSNVKFGITGSGGGSVSINAEDILGLDTSLTVWRVDAMYRPGKTRRNQLDFTYAAYHRDGSASLSEEIDIGGTIYPINTQIESLFNFDIIRGTYSFAFVQTERARIALGLGVYAVPLEYGFYATTTGLGGTRDFVEGANTTLPLPALALRTEFQVIPKLFFNASIDGMYLEIDNFQGYIWDLNVGLEYRPWKHLGLGVGYNGLAVHVDGQDGSSNYPGVDFVGSVDVRFSGLLVYAKWTF